MFDLSNITLAFSTAAAHEEAFALMCEDMRAWFEAGEYPSNKDLGAAILAGLPHLSTGTVKVYASRMLSWAKAGKQPASLHAMVKDGPKAKGKGGRKAKPETDKAAAEAPADDPAVTLQGFVANATKLVGAADVARFQDGLIEAIACLKRARS